MAMMTAHWPRRRLQLRSALSATMPIAWIWVAATALIPYFLIGRGRGAGSIEFLGVARTTWLSYHVWSSITVGLLTMVHVLLNRRGVVRSYRILGASSRVAAQSGQAGQTRSFTWVAALALLLVTLGGSLAFAAVDGDRAGGGGGGNQSGIELAEEDQSAGAEHAGSNESATGLSQGARNRGGRGGGG